MRMIVLFFCFSVFFPSHGRSHAINYPHDDFLIPEWALARNETFHPLPEVEGSWIFEPNKTFSAPICCPSKRPECEGIQVIYKTSGHPDKVMGTGGHACCLPDQFEDKYTWKSPKLKDWDARKTCKKLGNRNVLMIGDSTMQQTSATLMNSLMPAGCQTQIFFSKSDTLVGLNMGAHNRGRHWVRATTKTNPKPDIVIVTAGGHIKGWTRFWLVLDNVNKWKKKLEMMGFNKTTFVWKSYFPGGCTPEISPKIYIDDVNYDYSEFYSRDLLALTLLPKYDWMTLDVRMLFHRSDAHPDSSNPLAEKRDCLHLCAPGPIEVIGPLFYDLLERIDAKTS